MNVKEQMLHVKGTGCNGICTSKLCTKRFGTRSKMETGTVYILKMEPGNEDAISWNKK